MISAVALPFVAIIELDAAPFQVASLRIAQVAAAFVFRPVAEALVDCMPRLPLMIGSEVIRGISPAGRATCGCTGFSLNLVTAGRLGRDQRSDGRVRYRVPRSPAVAHRQRASFGGEQQSDGHCFNCQIFGVCGRWVAGSDSHGAVGAVDQCRHVCSPSGSDSAYRSS